MASAEENPGFSHVIRRASLIGILNLNVVVKFYHHLISNNLSDDRQTGMSRSLTHHAGSRKEDPFDDGHQTHDFACILHKLQVSCQIMLYW